VDLNFTDYSLQEQFRHFWGSKICIAWKFVFTGSPAFGAFLKFLKAKPIVNNLNYNPVCLERNAFLGNVNEIGQNTHGLTLKFWKTYFFGFPLYKFCISVIPHLKGLTLCYNAGLTPMQNDIIEKLLKTKVKVTTKNLVSHFLSKFCGPNI
jgi:hypothetical protein